MNMGFFVRPLPRWIAAILVSVLLLFASQSSSFVSAAEQPTLTGVAPNATGSTTATVTFSLTNPYSESATVYMRYGTGGSFGSVTPMTTTGTQVEFTLTGLLASTVYNVVGVLANETPFDSDVSGTFTTHTPSISNVADGVVTHNSAKINVTVSYPAGSDTSVNLQYKKTSDSEFLDAGSIATTTTGSSEEVVFDLSSLSASTSYTVQASLDSNFTAGTITEDTFTTSAPPASITTVADSEVDHDSAKITVTFSNPASGGTTVYLQRKKRSDANWPATNTAQQLTATSTTLSPAHTYMGLDASTQYDVRASLVSDFSSGVITDDFTTSAPPASITTVADSDVTHNSAKITVAVSNAGSGTTVYLQHKKRSVTGWPTTTPPSMNATSGSPSPVFTLSSLDASTLYDVRASLKDDFSDTPVTDDFTTLAAPTVDTVSVSEITYSTAKATVSLSDTLNTEVFLRHKVSTAADSTYIDATSQTTSASSINFTLGSLTAGTGYTVQTSLKSNFSSSVRTATFTTPSINSVAVSGETHKSAKVTATVANVTTSTNNTTVHVRYQESGETSWMTGATGTATSADSTPEITLSGLSSGKTYTVEAAFDSNSTISVKSDTFSTPGISTVTASSITHNSATVSVTVSNPNDTPIFLQYKQDSEADSEYKSAGASKTATALTPTVEFPLASLYRFTDYDVQVSFESTFPAGGYTEDKDKLFKALSTVPNKPEMLALTAGNGQFAANWNAPDDDGGSAVTGYKIQSKSGTQDYNITDRQQTSTTTSATVTGLARGIEYDVQVIAVNDNGDSEPSDDAEIGLLDVPNDPTGVGVVRGDGGEFVVTWTAPTTDDLHPVDSYVVRWKCGTDDYGASQVAEGITVLTHTITGLINGTECEVTSICV